MTTTPLTLQWSKTGLNPVQLSPEPGKAKGQNGKSRVTFQPPSPSVQRVSSAVSGIPKPPVSSGVKKMQNAVRKVTRKGKGVLGPHSTIPIPIQGGTRRNSKADPLPPIPLSVIPPRENRLSEVVPETKMDDNLVEASILRVPEHVRDEVRAALRGESPPSRRNSSAAPLAMDFIQNLQPVKAARRSLSASDLNRAASNGTEEFVIRQNPYDFPLCKIIPTAFEIGSLPLPDAEELQLAHTNISDDQLLALLARFPNLKAVVLMHCPNLTHRVLEPLSSQNKLEYLSLHSCKGFTSDQIFGMLTEASWPYIDKLDFCDTAFNDECLTLLANFPSLRTIELSLCVEVTRAMIEDVKKKSRVVFVWEDGHSLETQKDLDRQGLRVYEVEPLSLETVSGGVDTPDEVQYMDLEHSEIDLDYEIVEPSSQFVSLQRRFSLKQEKRVLILAEFFAEKGIYENFESELDRYEKEITTFYMSRCAVLNRSLTISRETWLEADLLIQKNEAQENMKKILAAEWDDQERGINWEAFGVPRPSTIVDFMALLLAKPNLFGKIKMLNLSNMGLTFCPQVFAQADFHSLETLDLSGNELRTLPPNFFCFAPNLKKVLLQKNRLLVVPPDLLQYWHELSWLDLSGNSLKYIPSHFLTSAKMLETIEFSNNELTQDSFAEPDWEIWNAHSKASSFWKFGTWKRNR